MVHPFVQKLGMFDLRLYAGDLTALQGEEARMHEALMMHPVVVRVTASPGVCDADLYDIVKEVEGRHDRFEIVRQTVMGRLAKDSEKGSGWNLLAVLFEGIYVADPEDLLNRRLGREYAILHRVKGFGEKVAEIDFPSVDSAVM